jgi:Putative transposase
MCATAANLIERVLPETALRQWVLTFPFPWRRRLAYDGALLSALNRIFVETVHTFYTRRAAIGGAPGAKTGAVTVVQRTSSDLRLNPHLHVIFLDGAYHEDGAALTWEELGHLKTREVGELLAGAVRRMARYLRRHGAIEPAEGEDEDVDPEEKLAASAVSGQAPPAGPQWLRGLSPLTPSPLAYDC